MRTTDSHSATTRFVIRGGGFGRTYTVRHLERLCRRRAHTVLFVRVPLTPAAGGAGGGRHHFVWLKELLLPRSCKKGMGATGLEPVTPWV